MSLLGFLRIIEGIRSGGGETRRRGTRRLELEALERRAVLTVLDASLPPPVPLEATITETETVLESPPQGYPMAPPPQESLPPDDGGSAAEPILYGGDSTEEPISEPQPNDPSVEDSGSSSELGGPPSISSIEAQFNSGQWVSIVGTVTDPGGTVEGMTVYFMVGLTDTISFTTTVESEGSFRSHDLMLLTGTLVRAYTIDYDGNYSEIAICTV